MSLYKVSGKHKKHEKHENMKDNCRMTKWAYIGAYIIHEVRSGIGV